MENIRTAHVAGYFYPGDPQQLRGQINDFLKTAKPPNEIENIFGIVSPHAGYAYSGKTAAYVYNLIKGKNYKRVIIISPSHSEYFSGISVYNGDAYETPLGLLEVDKEFVNRLVENSKTIFKGVEGHRNEHALEVQLPFLQSVLNDFKIVPVVMGEQSRMFVDELAKKLSEVTDYETLIVSSSDMSHFHSKSEADKLDSIVEKRITSFDFDGLQEDLDNQKTEACGGGPIVAMMKAAALKNKHHALVVHRSDSGDVFGDNREVVGYLSAVVYGD
jgi:AmmeMemoRadiSam system protein B